LSGKRIVTEFEYYPINGASNTAELILSDGTVSGGTYTAGTTITKLGVGTALIENAWNTIRIITETDGTGYIAVNGDIYATVEMAAGKLPTLSFSQSEGSESSQSYGYIDNLVISTSGYTAYEVAVGYNGSELSTTDTNVIDYASVSEYALDLGVYLDGAYTEDISLDVKIDSIDKSHADLFSIENGKIVVSNTIDNGTYDFVIGANISGDESTYVTYPIRFNVKLDPNAIITNSLAALDLDTAQSAVTLQSDGTYKITDNFALPILNSKATITGWTLTEESGEAAGYASIRNNQVIFDKDNAPKNYNLKLTVNIEYSYTEDGATEPTVLSSSREYTLIAPDLQTIVYYEEDFEGFDTGTIVDLSISDDKKPVTYSTEGMSFNSGTRATGGSTENSITVVADNTGNKYIQMNLTNYYDAAYYSVPTITFSRNSSVRTNSFIIKADLMFGSTSGVIQFNDTSNNTLAISAPATTDKWYTYEMYTGTGVTYVFVYDKSTGEAVDYQELDSAIKRLSTINLPNANVGAVSIDNLQVIDSKYSLDYATIEKVASDKLVIDDTQSSISFKNDIYSATGDFDVPEVAAGASVTWEAYQKKSGETEWQPSSFITVAGTNATINPTNDASDYEIKLVATIRAGSEEPLEKEFIFTLPNPMEEIEAVLASGYEKVKSADDAETKFDLNGTDILKYDLVLPTRVSGYANTTIAWTSSDEDHVAIADDGTATIMTSDLDIHDVTLTAAVIYKKGNITYSSEPQVFNFKMGYTSEDVASEDAALGKYKVRFDAAYDDNFKTIPSSTSSSITLPTTGKFGSTFTWNSSVPTTLSNSGVYSKPSTTKNVVMTATIVSGAASTEKQFKITVPGTSSSSGGGGGGGGSTSSTGTTSSSKSTGSVATSTTTAVAGSTGVNGAEVVEKLLEEAAQANDAFTDISSATWAREAINGLAAAGIINGKSETEFAPNDTVTRAEFAKMLMGVFGLNSASFTSSSFGDVSTDAWYFQAVETAYNLGIITGIDDGVFAPDALITRQDMAVMVSRAAAVAGKTISEVSEAKSFADASSISSYAVNAVDELVKGGIINGMSDTEFAPLSNATRAQAAKILYSFL
ncbi:MAG: S-layer homology domain-containing protein, partial [Candidatus Ornithomonoglobus sp.]